MQPEQVHCANNAQTAMQKPTGLMDRVQLTDRELQVTAELVIGTARASSRFGVAHEVSRPQLLAAARWRTVTATSIACIITACMRLPQARDFDRLRRLLELIASGLQNRADLGQQMGAKAQHAARHADYYREAAEILGLLERRRWSLTARGRGLLATKQESEEERELLRAAVADATDLGAVRHALLSDAPPDLNELVEYALGRVERGSRATVERRVKDILSWRARLGLLSPATGQHVADTDPTPPDESQIERGPQFDGAGWPTPTILPFNWRASGITVAGVVFESGTVKASHRRTPTRSRVRLTPDHPILAPGPTGRSQV